MLQIFIYCPVSRRRLRIHGDIERVKYKVLDNDDLRKMLYEITPEDKVKSFEETGDVDFGYEIPGLARYRANYFMQKNGIGAVFREIPSSHYDSRAARLCRPVISKLASLPRGLVIVTGPTGSGKSTTLAAIIDVANRTRSDHIITDRGPHRVRSQKSGVPGQSPGRLGCTPNPSARLFVVPFAKTPISFWWAR
jgi:Tfp pilus assembly pilus retraction ATPase PilT